MHDAARLHALGKAPLVVLGAGPRFPSGWICCGGGSTIAVGADTGSTWSARVDADNGGAVTVGGSLRATGVIMQTDDMHAIRGFAAGARLNPQGGGISISRHAWLGHEALLLPGARIRADTMVGARALVAGPLPSNAVCVGIPARAIRRDVIWAFEDRPEPGRRLPGFSTSSQCLPNAPRTIPEGCLHVDQSDRH